MTRVRQACAQPYCSALVASGYCEEHKRPPGNYGASSARVVPLPRGWKRLRELVLGRDNHRCVMCGAVATHVDHIKPAHLGGTDELDNLQSLCEYHHFRKTAQEARAARSR